MGDYPENDVTECVLEHYIAHHELVLKKLYHAKKATVQGLEGVKDVIACSEEVLEDQTVRQIKSYEETWAKIIDMFRHAGVTESEMEHVEDVLLSVPKAIKECYEILIQNDAAIAALIKKLDSEEYRKAIVLVQEMQARANPLSGLTGGDYDFDPELADSSEGLVKSYKIPIDYSHDKEDKD